MSILTAGKGDSKYNIHISNKIFSKNILNKYINKKGAFKAKLSNCFVVYKKQHN